MKNVLFITWDSDQTNYLESLFFPIFNGIQNQGDYKFIIAQYSWAGKAEIFRINELAHQNELDYFHFPVSRFPHHSLGALWTVFNSGHRLKELIDNKQVEILMPRSTMPAWIVNRILNWIKSKDLKIIFDADGFPLQERIDFAGLNSKGILYRFLKRQEVNMLSFADVVLTRSDKAIQIHRQNHPNLDALKFFKVRNGRNPDVFKINVAARREIRAELEFSEEDYVWVYTGSLGPAYAWDQLLEIFRYFLAQNEPVKLLVLTRNFLYLNNRIPKDLHHRILVRRVSYEKIPDFLNAGDLGINLRVPSPSLAGLYPIKLGEYLLTGLPVFAEIHIGDTRELIKNRRELVGVDLNDSEFAKNAYQDLKGIGPIAKEEIRNWAVQEFTLENSIRDYLVGMGSLQKLRPSGH